MKELFPFILRLWQMDMIETSIRSTALFVLAGGTLLLLRRASASARVLVCRLTLAGLLALPICSALLPPLQIRFTLPAPVAPSDETRAVPPSLPANGFPEAPVRHFAGEERITLVSPTGAALSSGTTAKPLNSAAAPPLPQPPAQSRSLSTIVTNGRVLLLPSLFTIWTGGVALSLLRLITGTCALRRLAIRATAGAANLRSLTEELVREAGLKQPVRLLQGDISDRGQPPITWGCHPPVIWLPTGAAAWPRERVRAVVLHELAHIARYDWLVQLLATLVFACYWFHPGVWLLCRRLRQESERACDDYALSCGMKPSVYATHLLETTKMITKRQSFSTAVSMAQPSLLESRLRSILDTARARNPPPPRAVIGLILFAGLCLFPLASLRVSASRASAQSLLSQTSPANPIPSTSGAQKPPAALHKAADGRNFALRLSSLIPGSEFLSLISARASGAHLQESRSSAMAMTLTSGATSRSAGYEISSDQEEGKMDTAGIQWGEISDGLQAGIRLTGKRFRYAAGENVPAECYIRNTTQKVIAFAIPDDIGFYDRDSPTIYAANERGKTDEQKIARYDLGPTSNVGRITLILEPGETLVLENPGITLGDVRGIRLGETDPNDLTPFPYLLDPKPGHYRIRQAFRYTLTTPAAFEKLWKNSQKNDNTRKRTVLTAGGKTYQTKASLSDMNELPSSLWTGTAEFVVVNRPPANNQPNIEKAPGKPAPLVWGKPLSGLEGALRLKENRRYFDGERMEWEYLVRNITNRPVIFSHEPFPGVSDTIPDIVGSDGKKYQAMGWVVTHLAGDNKVTLQPGEMAVVGHPELGINRDEMLSVTLHNSGSYKLSQYFHFWTVEKGSQDLMSGEMEFTLAGNEENAAWGKPVSGLQAGLSFHGRQTRYKAGETIGMDYFIRNVGKQPVRFTYHPQPQLDGVIPVVTDLNGKQIDLLALPQGPYSTAYNTVTLQPGESMIIGRQKIGVPLNDKLNESINLRTGQGKYRVSQSMPLRLQGQEKDATSLASGSLEFQVVEK